MTFGVDPRPRQDRPPTFTTDDEQTEALNLALDALQRDGRSHDEAKPDALVIARRAVKHLHADPRSGEPVWTLPGGRAIRGASGRAALVEHLAREIRLAEFGPDPRAEALRQLADRGVSEAEADKFLPQHRMRRDEDGTIVWTPAAGERTRRGGGEVITEAVRRVYESAKRARVTDEVSMGKPADLDAAVEAQVRSRHHFSV